MARPKLPRCRCCGSVIHGNPISIVFFARSGDRFCECEDDNLYSSVDNFYCVDCACAVNAVMTSFSLTATGGGGVQISRE